MTQLGLIDFGNRMQSNSNKKNWANRVRRIGSILHLRGFFLVGYQILTMEGAGMKFDPNPFNMDTPLNTVKFLRPEIFTFVNSTFINSSVSNGFALLSCCCFNSKVHVRYLVSACGKCGL